MDLIKMCIHVVLTFVIGRGLLARPTSAEKVALSVYKKAARFLVLCINISASESFREMDSIRPEVFKGDRYGQAFSGNARIWRQFSRDFE